MSRAPRMIRYRGRLYTAAEQPPLQFDEIEIQFGVYGDLPGVYWEDGWVEEEPDWDALFDSVKDNLVKSAKAAGIPVIGWSEKAGDTILRTSMPFSADNVRKIAKWIESIRGHRDLFYKPYSELTSIHDPSEEGSFSDFAMVGHDPVNDADIVATMGSWRIKYRGTTHYFSDVHEAKHWDELITELEKEGK